MSKLKQSTLFSLKSWKKANTESVLKFKKVLESKTLPESVVLKTLACLKGKTITKESISSAGIGETLKVLAKGSNLKVAHEARALIKYWNVDISENETSNDVSMSQTCIDHHKTLPVIEIIEVQTPMDDYTPVIECSKTPTEQKDEINPKLCTKDQTQHQSYQKTKKFFGKELRDGVNERQMTHQRTTKKNSISGTEHREIKRRLVKALELFTQALGEQEVRFYLKTQTFSSDYERN